MKRCFALVFCLGISLGWASRSDAAPQFGRAGGDRVCLYQDVQYRGWEECFNVGDEITDLRSHRNSTSSIRVFGRARVVVYEHTGFEGESAEFSSDVPDLGRRAISGSHTWNDRIDSLKVVSGFGRAGGGNGPFGNGPVGRDDRDIRREERFSDGICVYEHSNYEGRSECWGAGADLGNLGRSGWSDKISAIRVFGRARAVLYRDINFRGESIVVDQDVPDLARIRAGGFSSWNNQISSLRVQAERGRFRGFGR